MRCFASARRFFATPGRRRSWFAGVAAAALVGACSRSLEGKFVGDSDGRVVIQPANGPAETSALTGKNVSIVVDRRSGDLAVITVGECRLRAKVVSETTAEVEDGQTCPVRFSDGTMQDVTVGGKLERSGDTATL